MVCGSGAGDSGLCGTWAVWELRVAGCVDRGHEEKAFILMVRIWPFLAGGEKKMRLYNWANLHVCVEKEARFLMLDTRNSL